MGWGPGLDRNFIRVPQHLLPSDMFYGKGIHDQLQRLMGNDLPYKSEWTTKPPVDPRWGRGRWLIIEGFSRAAVNQPSWELTLQDVKEFLMSVFSLLFCSLSFGKFKSLFKFKCLECSVFELLLTLQ